MDYIIVGAGPCGLTIAYLLAKAGKTCVLLDSNGSIGGCHRVRRVNGMFTEHSPRVYLSSYKNFSSLLEEFGRTFSDFYTPDVFGVIYITLQMIGTLRATETLSIIGAYLYAMSHPDYGANESMDSFMTRKKFSNASRDYMDRLCRFTDGAGSDRYSLYQFIQLGNQQSLYGIYQPRLPNDIGIFRTFTEQLNALNVPIQLNTRVTSVTYDGQVTGVVLSDGRTIQGQHVILAVPPNALVSILNQSPTPIPRAFGNLSGWVSPATYNNDIAATFHWDTKLVVPDVWGFPSSDWGLVSIPLSTFMHMNDPRSKTVLTTCITYTDRTSRFLNKTANQVMDRETLVAEMFRQLTESYPTLPPPTTSLLSPTVYYENGGWRESDSAFFKSFSINYIHSHGNVPGLYQVGVQNGQSSSAFTTMEAAITNAMRFVNQLQVGPERVIHESVELFFVLKLIFLILLLIVFLVVLYILYLRRKK